MRVLGVDPGSRTTGFGLVEMRAGRLFHLHDEELKLSAREAPGRRLARLFEHTGELITDYAPEQVAVEGVFYGSNVKSMLVLGEARGAVMVAAARLELPIYEYPPAQVKQAIVGYGRATKEQIQHMVKLLLQRNEVAGEHAADALAIAICHLHSQTGPGAGMIGGGQR
jgi:crossover junction endodeoxyribonuclease RuvC